ncbi:MAG: hypothetical protein J2P17_23485 [Mycobacterium sp.]|nr:hypothetical protein [Mycobacterium sp.]
MLVRSDDEVYRVDHYWLGLPKKRFPVKATYAQWGMGMLGFLLIFSFVRVGMQVPLGFWPIAWSVVGAGVVGKITGRYVQHERPLTAVLAAAGHELFGPRRRTKSEGGRLGLSHVRFNDERPRLTGRQLRQMRNTTGSEL